MSEPSAAPRRTPLADTHQAAGARMVDFAGWWMPIQYESILAEHHAVRQAAGLFDISHMGEVWVGGPDAGEWLNSVLANDVAKLGDGQGQYTFLLNHLGGVIDDLIVYRMAADRYLLVVNASMIDADVEALREQLHGTSGITIEDRSETTAGLALQGPHAADILSVFLGESVAGLPKRNRIALFPWQGLEIAVARTGYTGEDGVELFFDATAAVRVWDELMQAGAVLGLKPCGLGARDTLRLEACLPLNGQDLSAQRTPVEAGLEKFIALDKAADFPGKEVCERQVDGSLVRKLVAFKLIDRGAPPRPHYKLLAEGKEIGEVTSGGMSPTLGCGIGMGYVLADYAVPGREIEVAVRNSTVNAVIAKKPLYKRGAHTGIPAAPEPRHLHKTPEETSS